MRGQVRFPFGRRAAAMRRTMAQRSGDGSDSPTDGTDLPDTADKTRRRRRRRRGGRHWLAAALGAWRWPAIVFAVFAGLTAVLLAMSAMAVQPEEMLDDPVLEERAREISKGLRCVVCQNQSIDDSDADIAGDMRVLVRERLMAGDTDDEVRQTLVDAYGEFVLLKPRFTWTNAAIWAAPLLALLLGGIWYLRRTGRAGAPELAPVDAPADAPAPPPLSPEEQARLDRLLKE